MIALRAGGSKAACAWAATGGTGQPEGAALGGNIHHQVRVVGGIDFKHLTGFINHPPTRGVQARMRF